MIKSLKTRSTWLSFLLAGWLLAAGAGLFAKDDATRPPQTMELSEFPIVVGDRVVPGLLAEPNHAYLAADPAPVLTFALTRQEALTTTPHNEPAKVFVAAGHRALSFDLPEHGDQAASGLAAGIAGMCQALLAGDDPFVRFVAEGHAAIDACLSRRLARPGRIYVCGV